MLKSITPIPPQTETATAGGGDATVLDLRAPATESGLRLERLLPGELWKRMQSDSAARDFAEKLNGELLPPLVFEREGLTTSLAQLRGPEGMSRVQLDTLRSTVSDGVERLGNLENRIAVEIARGPRWLKPSMEIVRKELAQENFELEKALQSEFRRRYGEFPIEAQPAELEDRLLRTHAIADRPFVRLRHNPLRAVISDSTMHIGGMPTKEMATNLQGMVTRTLRPNLNLDTSQHLISNRTGSDSTVAPGYHGPRLTPNVEYLARRLQGLFSLCAGTVAGVETRLDISSLSSPIGIVDIAVREPGKAEGLRASLSRAVSSPHRNVEITIVAPSGVEERGHSRLSGKGIVVGLNIAVGREFADQIDAMAKQGRSLELLRDLLEYPPNDRAGSALKWIRTGIFEPCLVARGQAPVSWDRATATQKDQVFELFAGTNDGRSLGEFSSKLGRFCRHLPARGDEVPPSLMHSGIAGA